MARKDPVANLPRLDCPYPTAERKYGQQVAEIIEKLHRSTADKAKDMPPDRFKWYIAYDRCEGPEGVCDWREYADYLIRNSNVWLVCIAEKWKGWAELVEVPDKVKANFEQHARLVCSGRMMAGPAEPEAGDGEPQPEDDLNIVLRRWLDSHHHDYRMGEVARLVIHNLVKSSEE